MNPGNGIETNLQGRQLFENQAFKLMNPGNGIETSNSIKPSRPNRIPAFKLMNPGNGIETKTISMKQLPLARFQINESWQRD